MNRVHFDTMHKALYAINWLDIMEPMNTQVAWEFFKTVFQEIKYYIYQQQQEFRRK